MIFPIFLAVVVVVVIGGGVTVFLVLRRRGTLRAVAAAILTMLLLVLLWPIPIHGGLTFLGEILVEEIQNDIDRLGERHHDQERHRFHRRQTDRFAQALKVVSAIDAGGVWREVVVAEGGHAWLDSDNGLLWSDVLQVSSTSSIPPLDESRQACRRLTPVGAWSLPSEGEQFWFWRHDGHLRLPGHTASDLAFRADPEMGLELPVVHLRGSSSNQSSAGPLERTFLVRCVARTDAAPEAGFAAADIPLEDWNRFQLSKSIP